MYQFEKPRINPDQIPGRKDLLDYFKRKQIEKYLEIFPKTVNFAFFKTMSEDDFQEYGISDDNDMQILIDAVAQAQAEEDAEEEAEVLSKMLLFFIFYYSYLHFMSNFLC